MGTTHVLLIRIEESQCNKLIFAPYYKQRSVLLFLLVCCDTTGLSPAGFQFVLVLLWGSLVLSWELNFSLFVELMHIFILISSKSCTTCLQTCVSWTWLWTWTFWFTILVAAQWGLPGCPVTVRNQTLKLSYYRCPPAHGLHQHHLKPMQDSISSQLLFLVKPLITRRWFCSVRAEISLFTASISLHSGTLLPGYRNKGVARKGLGEQTKALKTLLGGKGKGFFRISCYPQAKDYAPLLYRAHMEKNHS